MTEPEPEWKQPFVFEMTVQGQPATVKAGFVIEIRWHNGGYWGLKPDELKGEGYHPWQITQAQRDQLIEATTRFRDRFYRESRMSVSEHIAEELFKLTGERR